MPPPDDLAIGQTIADRFRILRVVGRGASATVYEAEDQVVGEPVALKALASGREAVRELQTARRISHANVCRVHDVVALEPAEGADESASRLVVISMELLEGETLRARLHRAGPPDRALALDLVRQLAAGLQAAHEAGVVHGDLSARNLVLAPSRGDLEERHQDAGEPPPRLVITDFGLSVFTVAFFVYFLTREFLMWINNVNFCHCP